MRLRRKAFTVVELLIVIIVVAVVAAVAIPRFANSRRRAQEASLRSTLRFLRECNDRFFHDHGVWPDDEEDFFDRQPPSHIFPNGTTIRTPWPAGMRYMGPYAQIGNSGTNFYPKDPVSGNNFSVSRASNGSLIIRSSATGNDSQGRPYSSY